MKPKVVIVGGGFGGLAAAKGLKNEDIDVTLIDKRNYHLFQPLLYQVATAGLSPADIAYPLRGILGKCQNMEILLGEVIEINKEERWVRTETNKVNYDYLILACGSTYTYFGKNEWEKFAPSLKTIRQATEIRRKVFLAFEKAERETDAEKRRACMTFVVVGGGPTGVELAGSLGEITRFSINKEFEHISPHEAKIILVEMGPKILPTMPDHLIEEAKKELHELGVEVRTNSKVSDITEHGITVADQFIATETVLWGAGVAASPINKILGTELDKQGRVIVSKTLNISSHPEIYVIGDQAHVEWGPEKKPLPGLAAVAMQEGRFVARYIKKKTKGEGLPEFFKYTDKGQMATIGRSRAVALFRGIEMGGFVAWLGWLFVHIFYLIGFKNKISVLFQWFWTYLTFKRGARLIVEKE